MAGRDPRDGTNRPLSPETLVAQGLGHEDPRTGSIVPPVFPSTTFLRDADGGYSSGYGYTRPDNPTYDEAQGVLARLEGGAGCILFSSGMAAATALVQALLPGDHVVAPRVMYWALRKWLGDFAVSWGVEVDFADMNDLDDLRAKVRPGKTRLVLIETPANPTWDVTDIAAAADIAHAAHALLVVDGTVAPPVLTRPIEHGADLVLHSATKYLNGHSDVLAGALVTARDDGYWQRVRAWRRDAGAVPGPFEAWLLLRGMRTLFVRVARACESALAVARHFESHPRVAAVLYPGLPSHPGHAIARRQMSGGFGGTLSIRVRGGEAAAMAVAAHVEVFKRATSLGGVESLVEHRASIEGPSTPVPRDLLRLSIGLESPADLIADLEQALERGAAAGAPVAAPAVSAPGGVHERIERLLRERVAPPVMDRGGDLQVGSFAGGTLTLRVSGSPGALPPLRERVVEALVAGVPEVERVRFSTDGGDATGADLEQAVRDLVEHTINPAVAAHEGRIEVVSVEHGVVVLRLAGRCQGCGQADVTVRQGVERLLAERVPGVVAVVDATDHAAGANPYYRPSKK